MKKVVSIALLVMLVFVLATTVKAATPKEDLYSYLTQTFKIAGKDVKLLNDDNAVEVERYLNDESTVIDVAQYEAVTAQVDKIVEAMNKANVTDVDELLDSDYAADAIAAGKAILSTLNLNYTYTSSNNTLTITDANDNVLFDDVPSVETVVEPTDEPSDEPSDEPTDEPTDEPEAEKPSNSNSALDVQTDIINYGYFAIPVVAIIAVAVVTVYKKVTAND